MNIVDKGTLTLHSYLSDYGACAHFRVIFPALMINQMIRKNYVFRSTYTQYNINNIEFYAAQTLVKFQRSASREQLNYIKHLKNLRKLSNKNFGIVYETDDLLLGKYIPEYNVNKKYYEDNYDNIKKILREVDAVIVSTEELKKELKHYNSNITVIENRLPGFLWNQRTVEERIENGNKKPKIVWGGSSSHFSEKNNGDFDDKLVDFIIKTRKEYDWVFFGCCPEKLKGYNEIQVNGWAKIFEFGRYMDSINPDIGIAPLQKNIFNDCKSNIKGLEFSSLGIPGIYSEASPYKGFLQCSNNIDEFIYFIEKSAKDLDYRKDVFNHDYNRIKNNMYMTEEYLEEYISKHMNLFNMDFDWKNSNI